MLSIIIPSYYKEELLYYGLISIREQALTIPYEILVLNDGIEDGTRSVCEQFTDLRLRYIFTGHRNDVRPIWRCPGFVINIAVKECFGSTILIQQPEIYYVTPNCIQDMEQSLKDSPHKIVSPNGILDDGTYLNSLRDGYRVSSTEDTSPPLDISLPFCMMLHRRMFMQIGGYDEDFTGYCFDDNDFVDRLTGAGCYSEILQDHKIIHLYHPRTPQYRVGLVGRNAAWEYNKQLYEKRKGIIIRNQDKNWGVL